jgi:hypothetical protein
VSNSEEALEGNRTANQSTIQNAREAALVYTGKGWRVVPVPHGEKGATLTGWNKLVVTSGNLDDYFPEGGDENIGLILGRASGGLVDVDLDCPEAVVVARTLLPPTGMIHGRSGHPGSHWWYLVDQPPEKATVPFKDIDKQNLVEIRSTGGQTVVPPSVHPSGERLQWDKWGEPAQIALTALKRAVEKVAAAALLARHWPDEGSRHEAALALAGALARAGWSQPEIDVFVRATAKAAGDEEPGDRVQGVRRSSERVQKGEPTTGWPRLEEILGTEVVRLVCKYLGCNRQAAGKQNEEAASDPHFKQSSLLVEAAQQHAEEFFRDAQNDEAFVALRTNNHREVLPLGSTTFRRWLGQEVHRTRGLIPSRATLDEAVETLAGKTAYVGQRRDVYLRVGWRENRIYLDLGNEVWSAVEIGPDGWRVLSKPHVYFRRPSGLAALPEPVRGGGLRSLEELLNLGDEGNWRLVVGWLLQALYPRGPYPVLVLHGEQGAAKSTAARALRSLVDPHAMPLRAAPRGEQDIAVAARNNWVLGWDNVSHIKPWQSDLICQIATGGGFATRRLYTNEEEVQIEMARPVLLNGIAGEMVNRPDLLDRALLVELPPIPDTDRRTEEEVKAKLDAARPILLGALLDAVSAGLRYLPAVKLDRLPRMADFVQWVEACGQGLGWGMGEFRDLLEEMRVELDTQVVGLWPVAPALMRLIPEGGRFQGTVADLLERLNKERRGAEEAAAYDWPRTARALAGELRRFTPALRRLGFEVEWPGRSKRGSMVRVSRPRSKQ